MSAVSRVLGVAMAVALFAGSCGGDDSPGDSTGSSSSTSSAQAFDVGEQYLRAFSQGGEAFDEAIELAAPDSLAERYAIHTQAVNESQTAAGEPLDLPELTVDGDVITHHFRSRQ